MLLKTYIKSVISLLNEPNCSSPANIEASVAYRKYRDASAKKKQATEYSKIISSQVKIYELNLISINIQRWRNRNLMLAREE